MTVHAPITLCERLAARVEQQGGNSSILNFLVWPEGSGLADSVARLLVEAQRAMQDAVEFVVDYDKSFDQMIADCKCDEVDGAITRREFPVAGSGEIMQRAFLVPITERMTDDELTNKLDRLGLEDARLEHVCALATTHTHLPEVEAIAARASFLPPDGSRHFYPRYVSLCNWRGQGRELALPTVAGVWAENWKILAIPKVKRAA